MDLDRLSNLLMNLGSPHNFLVQAFQDRFVYHYTDLAALRSIVTDGDLWLTNSHFSNDYEEGEHGEGIVEDSLASRSTRHDLQVGEAEFVRAVGQRLKELEDQGVYVCCFCLKDDLLSQWRSYGANGTGVSLGFATDNFEFIAGPDMPPDVIGLIYLWRVFYDSQKQHKIVDDCLALAWRDDQDSLDAKIALAVDAIRFFVPTFKNKDFFDEREARLIFLPSARCRVKPRFRVGRGMLVPYFSLKEIAEAAGYASWRPPLTSVRVGPSTNKDINRRGADLLLKHAGYPNVVPEVSNTPYRG